MKWDNNIAIAIDFDGTVYIDNKFDRTAQKYLKKIKEIGCILILWTCRTGTELDKAIRICREAGIVFDYINEYPLRESYPKINADFYVDDKAGFRRKDWKSLYARISSKYSSRAFQESNGKRKN